MTTVTGWLLQFSPKQEVIGELNQLYTIGHSNHSIEDFVELLSLHRITAVADVRSIPASRYTPQFNREAIRSALEAAGVSYVFLGKELGARSPDPTSYVDGKVQYSRLAHSPLFVSGIERLINGAIRERIALTCTEQDPLDCHRTILISRVLADRDMQITHIHRDGSVERHSAAMNRLRRKHHLDEPSLFESEEELLAKALELQESDIAYIDKEAAAGE